MLLYVWLDLLCRICAHISPNAGTSSTTKNTARRQPATQGYRIRAVAPNKVVCTLHPLANNVDLRKAKKAHADLAATIVKKRASEGFLATVAEAAAAEATSVKSCTASLMNMVTSMELIRVLSNLMQNTAPREADLTVRLLVVPPSGVTTFLLRLVDHARS